MQLKSMKDLIVKLIDETKKTAKKTSGSFTSRGSMTSRPGGESNRSDVYGPLQPHVYWWDGLKGVMEIPLYSIIK